jgi:hypothetical protein
MKITLISTGSKQDKGPSIIARFLEQNNHSSEIHFSAFETNPMLETAAKKSGLIVISANEFSCSQASKIIQLLKPLDIPLVYAGVYSRDHPEECIKELDLVITDKPKETILELANRLENFRKVSDIPNLWFKATETEIIKNA